MGYIIQFASMALLDNKRHNESMIRYLDVSCGCLFSLFKSNCLLPIGVLTTMTMTSGT